MFGGLAERPACQNFIIVIVIDTVQVINIKLCMMVLLMELLPVHTNFNNLYHISKSQQHKQF